MRPLSSFLRSTPSASRPSLGEESLTSALKSREKTLQQLQDLAKRYSPLVHDETVHAIRHSIESVVNVMTRQADLDPSAYIAEREGFLQELDNQIEESNRWKPILAGAAMLDRGMLEDEGIKRESEQALANLQERAEETIATIRTETEKSIQGAKELAKEIEARARRTATKISVGEAQKQFEGAASHDAKQVRRWSWLAGGAVLALVVVPILFMKYWPLPESGEWPVALYHTLLRVLVLSAIAGVAAALRMLRAHLHIAEKNRHRVRVANRRFVQSALEPAQRDLILARLTDSIVSYGDSGLVQREGEDRSSPMSGDVLGRIVRRYRAGDLRNTRCWRRVFPQTPSPGNGASRKPGTVQSDNDIFRSASLPT